MKRQAALSFGIKTTPALVGYEEIRRVWLEADGIPKIEQRLVVRPSGAAAW